MKKELAEELKNLSPKEQSQLFRRLNQKRKQSKPDTIPRADRNGPLALSFAQQRLWFLDQFKMTGSAYNMTIALRFLGKLNTEVVRQAFNTIVERHEVLRTRFIETNGQPTQVIDLKAELNWTELDFTHQADPDVQGQVTAEAIRPFDLANGPLLRATLIKLTPEDRVLILVMHHIISDGWSLGILSREFITLYDAYLEHRPSPLLPLAIQYADFAVWQRNWLTGEVLQRQYDFWKIRLQGIPSVINLPIDRPRPPLLTFAGANEQVRILAPLASKLRALTRTHGATLFMTLVAAYHLLLSRYSGQKDVVVGTPIANRTRPELEPLIGFFVNTLVLRAEIDDGATFNNLIQDVRKNTLESYKHQDIPFEQLVDMIKPDRSANHTPIYQTTFALQNIDSEPVKLAGLRMFPLQSKEVLVKFDLSLSLSDTGNEIIGAFEYNRDLFDETTIRRMSAHYSRLLSSIFDQEDAPVRDLSLLDEEERKHLLSLHGESGGYPADESLHGMIRRCAAQMPDAPAVTMPEEYLTSRLNECHEFAQGESRRSLTYAQLDQKSDRLAQALRHHGVGLEDRVGLCLERSPEMMIALLAILKAGAAYIPLDTDYPRERLDYMIQDAGINLLLTHSHWAERWPHLSCFCLDQFNLNEAQVDQVSLPQPLGASLAYIIYTSGSTGKPKGVMITHLSVVNHMIWMEDALGIGPQDRILQRAPLSFDASVWEVFAPLVMGAHLILARPAGHRDPEYLVSLCAKEQITIIQMVPSQLGAMFEQGFAKLSSVRLVCVGGEAAPLSLERRLAKEGPAPLCNLYGPSETTIQVIYWIAPAEHHYRTVPIGNPVRNTRTYILDQSLNPVPLGVCGRLYIGGDAPGRGYLGRAAMTAEKYIPDPYCEQLGSRIYNSGDEARYLSDDTIEFQGRADDQVKLRGHRIELNEIEAALNSNEQVSQSLVHTLLKNSEIVALVAYYIPVDKVLVADQREQQLRLHLAGLLPAYMVPAYFQSLDQWPRTASGKIDRKALPSPQEKASAPAVHREPRTDTEIELALIWKDILQLDTVGVGENFFQIGGHSLLATQVISRARKSFAIDLSIGTIFEAPTIEELALLIEQADPVAHGRSLNHESIPVLPRQTGPISYEGPLSFAQNRMIFLDQLTPNSPAYNMTFCLRLEGELKLPSLVASFQALLDRHETLRTRFPIENGQAIQRIETQKELAFNFHDLSQGNDPEADLAWLVPQETLRSFDLQEGPLFRVSLYRLHNSVHVLQICNHHIISDGWSLKIVFADLAEVYSDLVEERSIALPPMTLQYADFAAWQKVWLSGERYEKQFDYWRRTLAGAPDALDLPIDYPRAREAAVGRNTEILFDAATSQAFTELCGRSGVTPFMVGLSAFALLLSRYGDTLDVTLGTPMANRHHPETEGIIGIFVNTLVLRVQIEKGASFQQLLQQTRARALEAFAHQDMPFEMLVEGLHPRRDLNRSPLFQVMYTHNTLEIEKLDISLPGLTLSTVSAGDALAKFEITLDTSMGPDGLRANFNYDSGLFATATIERMAGHFQRLFCQLIHHPETELDRQMLLSETERSQLIVAFNATQLDYAIPADLHLLHQPFEVFSERTPNAIALVFESRQLTYARLNGLANSVAEQLRGFGVGPETVVGLYFERSLEMMIALLAVLKAGAAYLPLDPDLPTQRLAMMVRDAGTVVILSKTEAVPQACEWQGPCLLLDALKLTERAENPTTSLKPSNAAYVIYTSGSTGTPKGVINSHRGIYNRLAWIQHEQPIAEDDKLLQKTAYTFDVSIWEMFWPLWGGATLVLARPDGHKDSTYLVSLVQTEGITILHFVPSMLRVYLATPGADQCPSLRRVFCSGEALSLSLQEQFFKVYGLPLFNFYGPTEAAIEVTAWTCDPRTSLRTVPIGRPIANMRTHILDAGLNPQPVGLKGQLWLAGIGLARGYLKRPALTAQSFIPDPFATSVGERIYRSGDLARYLPEGAIEYLGRMDSQIKLRGFRIELGEIENALTRHAQVVEARVKLWPDQDLLVAYYITHDQQRDEDELRAYLGESLPQYMIPTHFVSMTLFPLTNSGKVDMAALEKPNQGSGKRAYVAPRTPLEELIISVWADLLGLDRLGAHDHFFELGGHSLMAIQVVSRFRDILNIELPLADVFNYPTVSALAQQVDEHLKRRLGMVRPPIQPVDSDLAIPLSFSQERLWFLDRLDPGNIGYNLTMMVGIEGPLDVEALFTSFAILIARDASLRTRFELQDGIPYQVIDQNPAASLHMVDLQAFNDPEILTQELSRDEACRPYDLTMGPLFRATLYRQAPTRHELLVGMHHIISDGWSLQVMMGTISSVYSLLVAGQEPNLPSLPVQYTDYARWQRNWLQGQVLAQQIGFWEETLAGLPPILTLPYDAPRPARQDYRGAGYVFELDEAITADLVHLTRSEGITPFIALSTAFAILLAHYGNTEDLALGTPVANRSQTEIEGLIGFFVNTLVLRFKLEGNPSYSELLRRARQTILGAYAHQDLPFEKLVNHLQLERDLSHTPLFQVMFSHATSATSQTAPLTTVLQLRTREVDLAIAKFDLTLHTSMGGGRIHGTLNYNTTLFKPSTIIRLTEHYRNLVGALFKQPDLKLDKHDILTHEERSNLLHLWNQTTRPIPTGDYATYYAASALREANAPALIYQGRMFNHGELRIKVLKLAERLKAKGAGPDVVIGLLIPRSPDLVVALLAVLEAGAAYLPLDGSLPRERLNFMLADSGATYLLSLATYHDDLVMTSHTQRLDLDTDVWPDAPIPSVLSQRPDSSNLAYIIYTSGSTGQPKGTMIHHEGLLNYLHWAGDYYAIKAGACVLLHGSIAFDMTVTSLLLPLLVGATIEILPESEALETLDTLEANLKKGTRYDLLKLTPSHLKILARDQKRQEPVRAPLLVLGGEALDSKTLDRWRQRDVLSRIINEYGPTETVVGCCVYEARVGETQENIPIGRPISNTHLYVLDRYLNPTATGVPGELAIGGKGLARGYLKRPALTALKFVPNPFSEETGARIYRTGDLVRYLPERLEPVTAERESNSESAPCLTYLGRIDYQIKLRGYRIEVSEIEAKLQEHRAVDKSLVVLRVMPAGDQQLVAYLIKHAEHADTPDTEVRQHLARSLPDYMVPAHYMTLESLPLSASGKVDLKRLPQPTHQARAEWTAPRNALEFRLSKFYEEVLGLNDIGVNDNFFALGGHSMLTVLLVSRLSAALNLNIPLAAVFQNPSVAEMARFIQTRNIAQAAPMTLITLQHEGNEPPIYWVHAIGGSIYAYLALSQALGNRRPFKAFQALGLNPGEQPLETIEALAETYLDLLEKDQPMGPIYLAGWSMGGVIAFEMARRLRLRGRTVNKLIMLDSQYSETTGTSTDQTLLFAFALDLQLDVSGASELTQDVTSEEILRLILEQASAQGKVPPGLTLTDIANLFAVYKTHWQALAAYEPEDYEGEVILFHTEHYQAEHMESWQRVTHKLNTHLVRGDHYSMLQPPDVGDLAKNLKQLLNQMSP